MAIHDALMRSSLGGVEFQTDDYSRKDEAEVKDGQGRTGTNVSIEGQGYITAADAASFAALLAVIGSRFNVSGQDFRIWGLGAEIEQQLLAAQCLDGGPHCSFALLPGKQGAALMRRIAFSVFAKIPPTNSSTPAGTPTNVFRRTTATRPDGLRLISYAGEIKGKDAEAFFNASVLPPLRGSFPPAIWVMSFNYEANQANDQGTYRVEFRELRDLLPAVVGAVVTDGQINERFERDEHYRLVRVVQFEFLIIGDPVKMRDHIRGLFAEPPLRENYEVTYHPETRVRGEFSSLASASMDDLMDWERSLECTEPGTVIKQFAVTGGTPIVYRLPAELSTYVDTGRAVGRGRYPKVPTPLSDRMAAPPKRLLRRINDVEFETSWTFTYLPKSAFEISAIFLRQLTRPSAAAVPANPPLFE